MGYVQGHFYTCAEVVEAYIAGARDCRDNGGNPSDHIIQRAADAYVKLVHPVEPETGKEGAGDEKERKLVP